jgi:hypothetical protein
MPLFPTVTFILGFILGVWLLSYELRQKLSMMSTIRIMATVWGIYLCIVYPMINYIWYVQEAMGVLIVPDKSEQAFHNWEIAVSGFVILTFIKRFINIKQCQ